LARNRFQSVSGRGCRHWPDSLVRDWLLTIRLVLRDRRAANMANVPAIFKSIGDRNSSFAVHRLQLKHRDGIHKMKHGNARDGKDSALGLMIRE
jgi:hypothetical protein